MPSQFSSSQWAAIRKLFAKAEPDAIEGEWLVDGTVTLEQLDLVALSALYASAAQGTRADTAYGWGNHASEGYLVESWFTDKGFVLTAADLVFTGDFNLDGTLSISGNEGVTHTDGRIVLRDEYGNVVYAWLRSGVLVATND